MVMKRFLKRWFGVTTKDQAQAINRKLSIIYAIVGWHCFGFMFYSIVKNRLPDDGSNQRSLYKYLIDGSTNLQVYEVKGFKLSNKYDISSDTEDIYEEGKETE